MKCPAASAAPVLLVLLVALVVVAKGYSVSMYKANDCSGSPLLEITYAAERCYQTTVVNQTDCDGFLRCAGGGKIDMAVLYGRCGRYMSQKDTSLLVQDDGSIRSYLATPNCTKGYIPYTPPGTCSARNSSVVCTAIGSSLARSTSAASSLASALSFWLLRQLVVLLA